MLLTLTATTTAQWATQFATQDDTPNGTGHQTISVGVINDNAFVALVERPGPLVEGNYTLYDDVNYTKDSCIGNYLVGYANATDFTGRIDRIPYGSAATLGLFSKWVSGFDEVPLYRAYKIFATPDSLVYVANNDPDHNILVFKLTPDSVLSTDYRMITGTDDIMGITVDDNGYVYVCAVSGTTSNTKEIKIYKGIKTVGTAWGTTYDDSPIQTIDLPTGVYRGLTTSGDGTQLFVSSMTDGAVYRYAGGPTKGYTKDPGFSFATTLADTIPGTMYDVASWDVGKPLGMAYLKDNNLLFVACSRWLGHLIQTHTLVDACYSYSKIFVLNPKTGARMDSLDIAQYYYNLTGSYTTQLFSDTAHAAGYTSTYDVGFSEKKNMFTQSMYSWVVERWHYTGTLPTVIINSVGKLSAGDPERWALAQNYPNPFNPTTSFRFDVGAASNVTLTVYDALGRQLETIVNQTMQPGSYTATWNALPYSSGVYFYKLQAGSFTETKRMVLMK